MEVAGLVKVRIQADLSEFDRGFAEARAKSGAFDREASRSFQGVGRSVKEFGREAKGTAVEVAAANDNIRGSTMRAALAFDDIRMRAAAAGAALAVAFAAVQPIFTFQDAVAEVSTLVDIATFDMKRMETSALAMAAAFGGGATAQVKAFNDVISAGTEDLARASQIVEAANKLAIGGASSVTVATDGLTNILNAYGDRVKDATAVSDAMFIAMRDGKTTIEELSSALGRVAPIAAQTNVSFDELTAAIAALTLGGISTAEAVTGVRAMLAAVAKPSNEAAKLAKALGIEFNVAGLQTKGLVGFLEDLMAKTGGSTDQLAVLFGGVEALVPAMALAGSAGESFANTMQNMAGKAGSTEEAFNKMANSPGFQAGRMWSALQAEIIGAGGALEALVPIMKTVADNMHLIVTAAAIFTAGHLVAAIVPVITQIAALTAGMGAAASAARALSLAMAFFGGPIGVAVTALAAAFLLLRDSVSAAEQATKNAKTAYDINERALYDSKAASEGYTAALRNQIAMQVEAARAASTMANADFESADARRLAFTSATGLKFAPFEYASDIALKEANTLDFALGRLEEQLAKVDGNLQKTSGSSSAAAGALAATGDASDKAAAKVARAYKEITDSAREYIAEQELERQALGLTEREANRLRYEMDLLNAARREGINLTPEQTAELKALAAAMADAEAKTTALQEAFDFGKDVVRGFVSDLRSGLEQGKTFWESFGDAAANALNKIADKLLNDVIDAIFQVNQAASSGDGGGGLFGWLGSLLGGSGGGGSGGGFSGFESAWTEAVPGLWAKGGYTGSGGKYEPAGIVHRGEYVFSQAATNSIGVGKLDDMHRAARGGYATGGFVAPELPGMPLSSSGANSNRDTQPALVRIVIEEGPMFRPTIRSESERVSTEVVQGYDQARENRFQNGGTR